MGDHYIYHICTNEAWQTQFSSDEYVHESLFTEGFIHCSSESQVEGVLDRYFKGQSDLIVLIIDTTKIIPPLKYEKAPIGQYFPHIYGPINKNAIIEIKKLTHQ
ncbi:MAG: DUF952 domain-containing protein [Saprospiraceae bacterium]|nr:DUF952 domain-containing protein [Saprospiraceae bacterium]